MDARYYESQQQLQDHHWWFVARSHILAELIEAWRLVAKDGEILDVGCGPGGPLLRQLERKYRVSGLEPEPLAVAFARQQGLECIQQGTLESFAQTNRRTDLVMLLDVLEHVEDDIGLLRTARQVLRPGGRLLVTVPALAWLWSGHDRLAHHYRRYTRRQLQAHLEAAGWICERISYFNSLLFPLAAVKKIADRFRQGSPAHGYYDIPGTTMNRWLQAVFASEARWLRHCRFPLGVSLVAVGRLPSSEPVAPLS
jgi:SAM-dependent methyltransferase